MQISTQENRKIMHIQYIGVLLLAANLNSLVDIIRTVHRVKTDLFMS